jgi:uncharacterized protein
VSEATVADNPAASRFEVTEEGQVAELVYRRVGDRLVLVHTGVPDELEGRGIGGALVAFAVDRATDLGLTVVPLCRFAADWLRRHPDVADRVPVEWPSEPS